MKPTRDNILVRPYYDPDKIATGLSDDAPGLWIPDESKDPMSHHGLVLEVGPDQKMYQPGTTIVYRPWLGHPYEMDGGEVLLIRAANVVGCLVNGQLKPKWDCVMVRPKFPERRTYKKGPLWIPRVEDIPPFMGTVVDVGISVATIEVGQEVLFDFSSGFEVGTDKVYYIIEEQDVLAILRRDNA